jgi:hypothetical protein
MPVRFFWAIAARALVFGLMVGAGGALWVGGRAALL